MAGVAIRAGLLAVALWALPAAASAAPARIAFQNGDDVVAIGADGSGRQTLAHAAGSDLLDPAWSPDGSRLAVVQSTHEFAARIATVGADGSGLTPLTPDPPRATVELSPAWSPDGTRVAFTRLRFANSRLISSIVVVGADGSGARTLVTERRRGFDGLTEATWTPDGSRIVYSDTFLDSDDNDRPELWSIAPDGSGRRPLKRDAYDASFSPDGTRMAYVGVSDRNGNVCGDFGCTFNGEIYVSAADGSNARRLTVSRADDTAPAWSPDGGRIVFASNRNYPHGDGSSELYSIAPDGSCMTWLTNGAPGSYFPTWEPGAARSSDPGACGSAPRASLVTTDLSGALAFARAPVYWVGPQAPRHLLLSNADAGRAGVDLNYADCDQYDASGCPREGFDVYSSPVCRATTQSLYGLQPRGLSLRRGALLYRPRGSGEGTTVFAGATEIDVNAGSAAFARALVDQLRPVGAGAPDAMLPSPALPRRIWRQLTRTQRGRIFRRRLLALGVKRLGC